MPTMENGRPSNNNYADFSKRVQMLSQEFGSRYALAKSSGIPASTLQSYEAGSKPGMDALLTLARVGNVDLRWLVTGDGEMRPRSMLSGALLKDVLMIDQYELGTAFSMQMVVGEVPYSRSQLETRLRIKEPTRETLLAVEAGSDLFEIKRGDLVLIDRNQATLARDGIFLLDFPGIELRAIFRRPDDKVNIISPEHSIRLRGAPGRDAEAMPCPLEMSTRELLGFGGSRNVLIGRAVWVGRVI
jgi:transcriptional regulator with XRE-family HTH domain